MSSIFRFFKGVVTPSLRSNVRSRAFRSMIETRSYHNNSNSYRRFNNRQNFNFQEYFYDPEKRKRLGIVAGSCFVFYLLNLKEAPVTGRRRFIWISPWVELKLSNYTYRSMLRETQGMILSQSDPATRKVEKIFKKIVGASYKEPTVDKAQLENIDWKIHVINDPRAPPNAFVLPGGKVFVFSEMLRISQNDDGLATVLSHEFAHQLARHTSENLSKAPIYTMLSLALYAITGIDAINNLLVDSILRMPASRQMEIEADYIGLMIMARACFHPEESINLWERMSNYEKRAGSSSLEFLSTHPASERRVANMQKWMPHARSLYEQSDCGYTNSFYEGFKDAFTPEPSTPVLVWH